MAQSGFTPIQLYRSTTAAAVPTAGNLVAGELAINLTDEKLYFENASGVVKVLADSTYVGTVTSVAASGGTTGMTFSGSPITGAGTLTLSGTLVAVNGGTGQSSYAIGDILFASTTTALSKLADVATGNALISGGVGVAPLYGKIGLTTHVSGTLPVANGGTGVTTSTGTGSVVLSDSPTLVTPTLGAASATSIANGLGAVGTPSYTFTGDLNTGLWSPGVDTIAFSTNGAERMRLDSSGNLGIGTASLAARFTVNGGAGTSQTRFEVSTTEVQEVATNAAQSAYANRLADAAQHIWKITGTERMRIDSSGNVGIGTSSPAYLLHLNQNGNTQAWVSATNVGSNSAGIGFENQGQRNWQIWADRTNDALQFGNNSRATTNMVITSAGNVGIGTSSPGAKLDVRSANIADGTNGGVINAYSTTAQAANIGGKIDLGGLYDGSNSLSFASVAGRKENSTSGDWSGYMQFSTRRFGADFVERMRIDSSGNVGIGTTSPAFKLSVDNGIQNITRYSAQGALLLRAAAGTQASPTQITAGSSLLGNVVGQGYDGSAYQSTAEVRFYSDATVGSASSPGFMTFLTTASGSTSTTERMRIDSSGNVGIGTSSPSVKLDVIGTIYSRPGGAAGAVAELTADASSGANGISLIAGFTSGGYGPIKLLTSATERMRIDSSGVLLVGTSATFDNVSFLIAQFLGGVSTKIAGTGSTSQMSFFNDNGRVGFIGTLGSTTSYNTSSDARLKNNVADADDAASLIDAIQVRKFDWKADGTHQRYGFIAQELVEVAPEAVSGELNGDEMMAVDYSKLVPMLIKEIQSLRTRVAQLEGN